jgi:cephalosporin hydroxylase
MITIDNDTITVQDADGSRTFGIGSPEGFKIISDLWLRSGWDTKYVYSFAWMGRPIIQLPEDMIRIQEVIYALEPTVIIETGIAHGGSLIFYASLFKAMGMDGRVIGVDIEIREHNRAAIEAHELYSYLTLIEGSSVDPEIVARVASHVRPDDRVLVILDSNHTKDHVRAELELYGPLATIGSYVVATDGIMEQVVGAPRTKPEWAWDNPKAAALEFVQSDPRFRIEEPRFPFNEGSIQERVTYWPGAFVKRIA